MIHRYARFQMIFCTDFQAPCAMIQGGQVEAYDPNYVTFKGGSPFVQFKQTSFFLSVAYSRNQFQKVFENQLENINL